MAEHHGRGGRGGHDDNGPDHGGRGGHQGGGRGGHGDDHEDKGAEKLIGGRGGHQQGGGGRGGAGVGGAGHAGNVSPELQQAIDNAKQDRIELQNAPANLKAQCQEACKNSEAEVIRLGGNLGMLGEATHAGGPGQHGDKGADELIGGRGGHQGGGHRGGRGGGNH